MSSISKSAWIVVGMLLWGLPTGVFLAMFLSVLKPGSWSEIVPFDLQVFFHKLMWTLPVFIIIGLLFGLFMEHISRNKD